MIALTIFALIASTLSKASALAVDNQIHLERKLLATWIAENEIVEMRSSAFAAITKKKKDIKYSGRDWIIDINAKPKKNFSGMPIPLEIKEVTVAISLAENPDSPLQTLTAFIAND